MTPDQIAALPYRKNVGIMLINPARRVWVGQRIDAPETAAWQMPQGGIDKGEAPQDAALRELTEETGIAPDRVSIIAQTPDWLTYDLPHDLVPNIWKGRWRGQKQKWFLMRFDGADDEICIDTDHPEFAAWEWSAPDQLVPRIVPFKRAVYEQVVAAFAPHLQG